MAISTFIEKFIDKLDELKFDFAQIKKEPVERRALYMTACICLLQICLDVIPEEWEPWWNKVKTTKGDIKEMIKILQKSKVGKTK